MGATVLQTLPLISGGTTPGSLPRVQSKPWQQKWQRNVSQMNNIYWLQSPGNLSPTLPNSLHFTPQRIMGKFSMQTLAHQLQFSSSQVGPEVVPQSAISTNSRGDSRKEWVRPMGAWLTVLCSCSRLQIGWSNYMILVGWCSSLYPITVISTRTDKLEDLGANLQPQNRRSTLLLFLARNPDTINTPQTGQESYRQHWMGSFKQNQKTILKFLDGCQAVKRSLKGILSSSSHIGVTRFALETCEMLVVSMMTDWGWLRKDGAIIGMEVCAVQIVAFSRLKIQ